MPREKYRIVRQADGKRYTVLGVWEDEETQTNRFFKTESKQSAIRKAIWLTDTKGIRCRVETKEGVEVWPNL